MLDETNNANESPYSSIPKSSAMRKLAVQCLALENS